MVGQLPEELMTIGVSTLEQVRPSPCCGIIDYRGTGSWESRTESLRRTPISCDLRQPEMARDPKGSSLMWTTRLWTTLRLTCNGYERIETYHSR